MERGAEYKVDSRRWEGAKSMEIDTNQVANDGSKVSLSDDLTEERSLPVAICTRGRLEALRQDPALDDSEPEIANEIKLWRKPGSPGGGPRFSSKRRRFVSAALLIGAVGANGH